MNIGIYINIIVALL